jgi:hypothetical protein
MDVRNTHGMLNTHGNAHVQPAGARRTHSTQVHAQCALSDPPRVRFLPYGQEAILYDAALFLLL